MFGELIRFRLLIRKINIIILQLKILALFEMNFDRNL